ncbi:MAG: hypothetical protein PHP25_02735 [Candidatus Moranbacteria bacterium]|nr:hypothetical protein [Candidatus Moranbacteria bacterium]
MNLKKMLLVVLRVVAFSCLGTFVFCVLGMMGAMFYQFLSGIGYQGREIATFVTAKNLPFWLLSPAGPFVVLAGIGWTYLNFTGAFVAIVMVLSFVAAVKAVNKPTEREVR